MAQLAEVVSYTAKFLQTDQYHDYCPNGLQVEGKAEIKKIVSGVTACQALIDAAIAVNADAILVHHGYFWKGEDAAITGIKRNRVQRLLSHDISLLAYHLPLDGHSDVGNNAQLGKVLTINVTDILNIDRNPNMFYVGELAHPLQGKDFAKHIEQQLLRKPLHIAAEDKLIKTIAWCTGGAQHYLNMAIDLGVDAYLTGEASEPSFHLAKETATQFFAAGHHATERYGVQALASHLAAQFDLEHQFIDIDNPI